MQPQPTVACGLRRAWSRMGSTHSWHVSLPPLACAQVLVDLQARALQPGAPPFPRLLYTIPHGQNPTGCTIPLHRKKEVGGFFFLS